MTDSHVHADTHPVSDKRRYAGLITRFLPKPLGLRGRIAGFAVILTVLSGLSGTGIAWWVMADTLLQQEEDILSKSANGTAANLSYLMAEAQRDIDLLAQGGGIRAFFRAREAGGVDPTTRLSEDYWATLVRTEVFGLRLTSFPYYRRLSLLTNNESGPDVELLHVERSPATPGQALPQNSSLYRQPRAASGVQSNTRDIGGDMISWTVAGDGTTLIQLRSPVIRTPNRIVGYLQLNISLDDLMASQQATQQRIGETRILSAAGESLWPVDQSGAWNFFASYRDIPFKHLDSSRQFLRGRMFDDKGSPHLVGIAPVHLNGWNPDSSLFVLYTSEINLASDQLVDRFKKAIPGIVVFFLAGLILSLLFAEQVRRAITQLTAFVSDQMTSGYSRETYVIQRRDELGELARTFAHVFAESTARCQSWQTEMQARKTAQNAASLTDASLRAVLDTLEDGLIVCDQLANIVSANTAAEKMFGYGDTGLAGKSAIALAPPIKRKKLLDLVEAGNGMYQEARIVHRDGQASRRDGSEFPVEVTVVQFMALGTIYFTMLVRDMTEARKQAFELEKFRAAVENAEDGVAIYDAAACVIYCNPAYQRIIDLPRDKIVGRRLKDLAIGATSENHEEIWAHIASKKPWHGQLGLRTLTNREILVDIRASPFAGLSAGEMYQVAVVRDILQQRILESELARAQKLEAIGQLAAGIAHEVNTPTQYVGDNLQFIRDGFMEIVNFIREREDSRSDGKEVRLQGEGGDLQFMFEEMPRAIDESINGCKRIAEIVKAMKEFAHPGAEKACVDLNRSIQSTITVATNEWKYVADMKTEFDPEVGDVYCRVGELNQAVLNLLVNAAHAVADVVGDGANGKGQITVGTRSVGQWVEIRVSDTGPGIPQAILGKIFDPFFTTKPVGRGTGQGLAIVYDVVVNKHGGTVSVESESGKGSTFILRFPAEPSLHAST